MKIAIVFTGVPRMLAQSQQAITQRLIGHHDVDVYSYVWQLAEWEQVADQYPHRDIQIMNPDEYARFPPNVNNIFPHWYGVQKACWLFQNHVNHHRLHYDLVVRTRHDIWPYHTVQYQQLNPQLLNVAAKHWPDHPSFVFDDNLTVTSMENYINFYSGFFNWYLQKPLHHYFDISEMKLAEYAVESGFQHAVSRQTMLDYDLTRGVISGECQYHEVKDTLPRSFE